MTRIWLLSSCLAMLTVSSAFAQFGDPTVPLMSEELKDEMAKRLAKHGWDMEIPYPSSLIEYREAADRAGVHGPAYMYIPELRLENAARIQTQKDFGNVELLLGWTWAAHHQVETDYLEVHLRETDETCLVVQLHPDTGKCVIGFIEEGVMTELKSEVIAYREGTRNKLDPDRWTTVGIRDMNGVISVYVAPSDRRPEQPEPGYNPKRPVVQTKYDKSKFTRGKVVITNRQVGRPELVSGVRVETFVRDIQLARK